LAESPRREALLRDSARLVQPCRHGGSRGRRLPLQPDRLGWPALVPGTLLPASALTRPQQSSLLPHGSSTAAMYRQTDPGHRQCQGALPCQCSPLRWLFCQQQTAAAVAGRSARISRHAPGLGRQHPTGVSLVQARIGCLHGAPGAARARPPPHARGPQSLMRDRRSGGSRCSRTWSRALDHWSNGSAAVQTP
jgi:hypothetical protein